MFGALGNLGGMLKQFKDMQGKMQQMQESLANARYESDSGAGAVTATVNGRLELVAIKINPDRINSDVEMLEDLIKSAVAAAQRKASESVKTEMSKLTGGLNLPGLEGLLGGNK